MTTVARNTTETREVTHYLVQAPSGLFAKVASPNDNYMNITEPIFTPDPLEARRYESRADAHRSKDIFDRWAGRLQLLDVSGGYEVVQQKATSIFYPVTTVPEEDQ